MSNKIFRMIASVCIIIGLLLTMSIRAERIRDLTTILGVRENALIGYGIVVGLDGTGDQTTQTPFTTQSLRNMLSQLGVTIPIGTNMQLKNVAAVMVTAQLPAFSRAGQKIDVVVSSLGNARSLRGGTLLMTPLKGVDNQVYALAQGNILVSGSGIQTGNNLLHVNQLNGGRISGGAIVERSVQTDFTNKDAIMLQLNNDDFSLAQQISDAINSHFNYRSAVPLDSRTINIVIPSNEESKIRFLASLQNIPIAIGPTDAVVVINSRTGSVVMNKNVVLGNCAVAHGQLTVEVSRNYNISQPSTPLGGGRTVVVPNNKINVHNEGGVLQEINVGANLNDVISTLNSIGAKPNDLMAILQSMQSAGCLNAKLEIN